jgi:diguanylate cyclase (GGDEF)-like protein
VDQRVALVRIMAYRAAAAVVIGAAVALSPPLGPHRIVAGAVVAAAGLSSSVLAARRIRAGSGVPPAIALGDVALALFAVVLAPQAYGVAITILASLTGLFVFWFGRRFATALAAGAGIALLVTGLANGPELWATGFVAWCITALFSIAIYGRLERQSREQRRRYDELVNGIDAAVWQGRGPAGEPEYFSAYAEDLLGFTPEQLCDDAFFRSRVHADDLDDLLASRRRAAAGQDSEVHFRMLDASGHHRRLHERVRVQLDADGRVVGRRGVLVDETARWEAEETIRRYSDFVTGIPIALTILRLDDADDPRSLRVLAANPAACRLVGLEPGDGVGMRLADIAPVGDRFLGRLADVIVLGNPLERPFLKVDGVEETLALRAVPLPDRCVGLTIEDVSKRARLAESFRHQALHDPLTGLPNRTLLNERLGTALAEAERRDEPVALLVVDLDQFKEVNDALGHEYGDRLLVELARRMGRHLRHCDTIARLGGDEFAILLTIGADEAGAREVGRRLLELCEEPFQVDDYRLQVAASIGIAIAPDHATRADVLMRRADGAMYRAKVSGGGMAVYFPGQDQANVRRLQLLADLRDAVTTDAFVVHYQPRVELASMRTVGVEALVRWQHPDHGLLAPSEFIELAEVSGAIRLLTHAVTERAAHDVVELGLGKELAVSVNLSVRNLYDPTLVEWVTEVLWHSGLPRNALCFELTESQLMDDPSVALDVLHRLRDVGVRLSVDDFGTGYSSLAYLRDLPLDEVKIDRRFVADLEHGDARIVRSVVDLGHNLGLQVVAEGVESEVVLERLRDLGCDSVQGFHLARPMPAGELARHLAGPTVRLGSPR